jgi:hypothetical protein
MIDPPAVAVGIPVAAHVRASRSHSPLPEEAADQQRPQHIWRSLQSVPDQAPLRPTARACTWSCLGLAGTLALLAAAWLRVYFKPSSPASSDTAMLSPMLCLQDGHRFLSVGSVGRTATPDAESCPRMARAQTEVFVLPASLAWGEPGSNESLVVLRSPADTLVLSVTLQTSAGDVLLSHDALIPQVPMSEPSAAASVQSKPSEEGSRRRMLRHTAVHPHPHAGVAHATGGGLPVASPKAPGGPHMSAAVRAGAFVTLLNHGHRDRCALPSDECQVRVQDPLWSEVLEPQFQVPRADAFPLQLKVRLEVKSLTSRLPTVFLVFHSPTGGKRVTWAQRVRGDVLLEWIWVPILLSVACCLRALKVSETSPFTGLVLTLGLTVAVQRTIYWYLSGMQGGL